MVHLSADERVGSQLAVGVLRHWLAGGGGGLSAASGSGPAVAAMHAAGDAGGGARHQPDSRLPRRFEVPLLDDAVCSCQQGGWAGRQGIQRRAEKILQRRGRSADGGAAALTACGESKF